MIEITWRYIPQEYFESDLRANVLGGSMHVANGVATFTTASEPADPRVLSSEVSKHLAWIMNSRALFEARTYSLSEPQYNRIDAEGRRHSTLFVHSASHAHIVDSVDLVVRDAAGGVVGDSKAERVARESSHVSALAEKCVLSPTLRAMIASFTASLADPRNSFVHLYEIRDAATNHFGDASTARGALGISSTEWRRLGELANEAPLAEGRHRGKSAPDVRSATQEELAEARDLAQLIIDAFSSTV
jgi:hypothetical protein